MGELSPNDGGCFFCHRDEQEGRLVFDCEWDTFVHLTCVRTLLRYRPGETEAEQMKYLLEPDENGKKVLNVTWRKGAAERGKCSGCNCIRPKGVSCPLCNNTTERVEEEGE